MSEPGETEPVKDETGSSLSPHELAHAAVRGAVAAAAMMYAPLKPMYSEMESSKV